MVEPAREHAREHGPTSRLCAGLTLRKGLRRGAFERAANSVDATSTLIGAAREPSRASRSLTARARDRAGWSGRRDSNPQHSAWKADALPLSYARDEFGKELGCEIPRSSTFWIQAREWSARRGRRVGVEASGSVGTRAPRERNSRGACAPSRRGHVGRESGAWTGRNRVVRRTRTRSSREARRSGRGGGERRIRTAEG